MIGNHNLHRSLILVPEKMPSPSERPDVGIQLIMREMLPNSGSCFIHMHGIHSGIKNTQDIWMNSLNKVLARPEKRLRSSRVPLHFFIFLDGSQLSIGANLEDD